MLAVHYLAYELSGVPADEVISIEQQNSVQLFTYSGGSSALRATMHTRQVNEYISANRFVDIARGGKSVLLTPPATQVSRKHIWIEVKTYKRTTLV